MSRTEYRFDGLDALEQQLSRMIEEEYPAEFRGVHLDKDTTPFPR